METITSFKIVYASIKVAGFHSWKGAPAEVQFLSARHRHEFHIKAYHSVDGVDREIEFFLLAKSVKDAIGRLYETTSLGVEFGNRSCEMIAEELGSELGLIQCDVSEDGENGAIWKRL